MDHLGMPFWLPPPTESESVYAPLLNAIEIATEQGFDQEAQELRSYIALDNARWRKRP